MYLCFDVGGTFVKYGVLADTGQIITEGKYPTRKTTKELFLTDMASIYQTLKNEYHLLGIGISFPGFIDSKSGVAMLGGAIDVLDGANIVSLLRAKIAENTLPIVVENDANCAAIAEKIQGAGQGIDNICLVTLGTGVGGSLIQEGKVISGSHYRAGEFGMMITDFSINGYRTLHELASTSALVNRYCEAFSLDSDKGVSGEMIMADPSNLAKEVRNEWSNYVALLLFNIVTQFDPEVVLIGGGISQNSHLIPLIKNALAKIPYWKDFKTPIESCQFHNQSGLIGAYCLISQKKEK